MIFGRYINKYYLRYSALLLLGLISLAVIDYAQLLIPRIYRELLTGFNTGYIDEAKTIAFDAEALLDRICMPMVWIMLVMLVGRFLWRVCFFGASVRTETALRRRMFDKAVTLSDPFYRRNKVGSLMSLFTNDLSTIEECFGWGLMMFLDAVILGGLAVYRMMTVRPVLALTCLIPVAFMIAIGMVLNRYMMKKWDERQESFSRISDFAQESFSGLAVIKAFVKEAKELLEFKKINRANEKVNVEFTRMSVLLRILVTLFVESVVGVILGFGGYLVYRGEVSAEALVEFIGYFTAIIWPAMAISELIDMHSRGKASLKRVTAFLDAEVEVKDRAGAEDIGKIDGKIEFRHLTFRYPGAAADVLSDVTFAIEAGETVGIVGRIGSGKTTLVDLLLRVNNVPDGTVFVDGKDVNSVTAKSLRENFAYVPQDNFLFSDTVYNNISFSGDRGREEVEKAARLACVDGDIATFENGYSTVLGERGVTVSGGQKQRISLACALLKDAPVLILDDSVSAVDTETEKKILANLASTRKGKTTVFVAHRISTIEAADKIAFLSEGKLLAFGSHGELMATCPEYARTVRLQKIGEKEAELK